MTATPIEGKTEEQENSAILYLNQLLINHLKTRNYGNIQFIFVGTGVPVGGKRDDVSIPGRKCRPRKNQIPSGQPDSGDVGHAGEDPRAGQSGETVDTRYPKRIRGRGHRHDIERIYFVEHGRGGSDGGACGNGGFRPVETGFRLVDSSGHDGDARRVGESVFDIGDGARGNERLCGVGGFAVLGVDRDRIAPGCDFGSGHKGGRRNVFILHAGKLDGGAGERLLLRHVEEREGGVGQQTVAHHATGIRMTT